MIFAGLMFVFMITIPETFAPVILKRRAARLRKETGDEKICTEQELFKVPFSQMMTDTLVRPFRKCSFISIYGRFELNHCLLHCRDALH